MLAKFLNIKFALTLGWLTKQPTLCYNPVAPAYLVWAHYAHGRQRSRCQEDPVGIPSGRLEKTTGSSPHHMAQHHPTGSETSPSYAPRSSRFGSEPPSVEDDVDVWWYGATQSWVACQKRRRLGLWNSSSRGLGWKASLVLRKFLWCVNLTLSVNLHYLLFVCILNWLDYRYS